MLPSKRKKIIIAVISVVCLILVILGVALLTNYIKDDKRDEVVSDVYPSEIKYIGIKNKNNSNYEVIEALKSDFTSSGYLVNSFYKAKDLLVKNNRLYIYSDAINELAYKKKTNEMFLNEIDAFYDSKTKVKLASDYIVFLRESGILEYRKYNTEEYTTIDTITSDNYAVVGNNVYYILNKEVVLFDLVTKTKTVITTIPEDYEMITNNNQYILFMYDSEYFALTLKNGLMVKITNKQDEVNFTFLSLFDEGFVYYVDTTKEIKVFDIVLSDVYERSSYMIEDNYSLKNLYLIEGTKYYIDIEDNQNTHKYLIVDVKSKEVVSTLNEAYENIIKVKE